MKNILGIFAIFILPIYFIVSSDIKPQAAEQTTTTEITNTKKDLSNTRHKRINKFKKLDYSAATQEKIKQFRSTLPEAIMKEVENFHAEKLKLKEAKEKLYQDLSVEAKTALKEERKIRLGTKN